MGQVGICGLKLYRVFPFLFVNMALKTKKVCLLHTQIPSAQWQQGSLAKDSGIPRVLRPHQQPSRGTPQAPGRGWRPQSWAPGGGGTQVAAGPPQRTQRPWAALLLTHSKYQGCKRLASPHMPPFYKSSESTTRSSVQKRRPQRPPARSLAGVRRARKTPRT